MAEQNLIDGLIATYRELNMTVRSLPEAQLTAKGTDGASIRDVVQRLRDSELRFSQALKERITGVPMPEVLEDESPVLGTEQEGDPTAVLISQFGTGRESTLAMLRSLPDAEWNQPLEGGTTITNRIQQLVDNDRKQLARIHALLGATANAR
jgi:hypothetical protein